MSLNLAEKELGWPTPKRILAPDGAGPRVLAQLADTKIGDTIRRLPGGKTARVGVLMGNAEADDTEAPLAVVCEFSSKLPPETLSETHRLAWNFCRSPLLITLENNLVRAWTCCETPSQAPNNDLFDNAVERHELAPAATPSSSQQAAHALHWMELVSGRFFRKHEERFRREHRADETLLVNLAYVREQLIRKKLGPDVAHDLLARIIFIQFLFHRKDSSGNPALNQHVLGQLHEGRLLSRAYVGLPDILLNYDDSYHFFRWLNSKFNGDLFPGSGSTSARREAEWKAEMAQVKPHHLNLLSEFVSGTMQMAHRQHCLWPLYSFDAIPLEFISSIYEMFVGSDAHKKGAHYTPGHLVDAMLDNIMPWNSTDWDIKVLDPACGSGIFLVKSFQRMVHRWRLANPKQEPTAGILRHLLQHNLFGVDLDPHAVRVASFSLYLAMCDEIDPRHYWKQVKFPRLRGSRLIHADFFTETLEGVRTVEDAKTYDFVVGNAPWGRDTATPEAIAWAKANKWPVINKESGTLFLPKAIALTKDTGRVRMIQPAGSMLFNTIPTAIRFRQKLLRSVTVEEIINLSALRFVLFAQAISPACVVTLVPQPPNDEPIQYISPKSQQTTEDGYRIVVDPADVHLVSIYEAVHHPFVWSALMWGGRRDLAFLERLSVRPSLATHEREGNVSIRRGVSRGDGKNTQPEIRGLRMLDNDRPFDAAFLSLDARSLPINQDPKTHSRDSTDMAAFQLPQMLIRQSWDQEAGRFKAALVASDAKTGPVFCNRSFTSVHAAQKDKWILEAACLTYNSRLSVYYLLLTSGRFAFYRPEPNKDDLLHVPLPDNSDGLVDGIASFGDVDSRVRKALAFKDAEQALIDDLVDVTLLDFKGGDDSPGRMPTRKARRTLVGKTGDPILATYCDMFLRVLDSGFDEDVIPRATIFQEADKMHLPLRMVAIHFDSVAGQRVDIVKIDSAILLERLYELNDVFLKKSGKESGGIFYQRVVRVYTTFRDRKRLIPTVYVVKPDHIRYWTRSAALHDADEIAAEMTQAAFIAKSD